jgi:nitrate reductase gamma subunit
MNGRFPVDVFLIIFFPFFVIAVSTFIVPLLIPEHAHHQLAVAIAAVLSAGSVLGVLFFWIRRGRRSSTSHLTNR